MAGSISSLGIGSGLDANSIVEKLMAIERAPLTALNRREASYQAKISAFGTIKTRFDALQTAADKLADPAKLAGFTASLGDEDVLSVAPGAFASGGSYNVNVVQVAQSQKSLSNLYASGTTFAAGTLTFSINGEDVDVAFGGGNINDLRSAINDAGIGVTATTVTGDAGSRLILTSTETGTDAAFSLSVSGGDANLASLATFDVANPNARTAQNAIIEVDGETVTSQSNEFSTVISGVTITAKTVGSSTVDIARTDANVLDTVKEFVTAYNAAVNELKTSSAYNAESGAAGVLNGDGTVRTLQGLLRSTAGASPAELAGTAFANLSSLGVSFQRDGTLALDETKLKNAIDTDFGAVTSTLNTIGASMETLADEVTSFDGLLANRTDGLNQSVDRLDDQRTRLEYQLELTEKRIRAQYVALDTLMGQLNTTSSYLTQQLASLNASRSG